MKIPIYHPTDTTIVKVPVIVEKVVPVTVGDLDVYPVQYRNYSQTIHIQHRGISINRTYGFAFDIPGQAGQDVQNRYIPSLAGTDKVYAYGVLVVGPKEASLLGVNDTRYNVPLTTLPF